jgi:hypothetical protein
MKREEEIIIITIMNLFFIYENYLENVGGFIQSIQANAEKFSKNRPPPSYSSLDLLFITTLLHYIRRENLEDGYLLGCSAV